MEIKERNVQFTGRKKVIVVDENNNPVENYEPYFVQLVRDEGEVYEKGTPLSIEVLKKANWHHHQSLLFKRKNDNTLPSIHQDETQIVTTMDGRTWLISSIGQAVEISKKNTAVKVNGVVQSEWNADNKQNSLTVEQLSNIAAVSSKQNALTAQQLDNIAAVPNKATVKIGTSVPNSLLNGEIFFLI